MLRRVGLIEASQYAVFGAVEAFLALYCTDKGIAPWLIGWILGIQLVGIILLKPLFGRLSDRVGRVPLIRAGLLTAATGVAAIPALSGVFSLTAASVVFGLGFAAVTSSTAALAADAARASSMGSTIGALRTLMDIGQTAGPVIAGFLIGSYGYGAGFGALAALLAFAAMVAWRLESVVA